MSGAEHSMEKIFARAAALLRGEELSAAGDHDAEYLLQALDYSAVAPGTHCDPETANRACLLMAASRFARVFELAAPDAPGLISFGAQFDPALDDSLLECSPIFGVYGVGLSLPEVRTARVDRIIGDADYGRWRRAESRDARYQQQHGSHEMQ